jgi:hypothetical protein
MSGQSSPDYTTKWVGHFGGPSLPSYTRLLGPQLLIQPDETLSAPTSGATTNVLRLYTADGIGTGSVSFQTTATLAGDDWQAILPAAMYRLICLGILQHLDEDSLRGACESLVDIYTNQRDRGLYVERRPPEPTWLAVAGVDQVTRAPFQFHDE